MHTCVLSGIIVSMALLATEGAWAQDAATDTVQPDQQLSAPDASFAAATPMPSEEVMRPTDHGLRMTPGLARALSRIFVSQLTEGSPLDPGQKAELNAILARRIMETARTHQELMQQVAEYTLETLMSNDVKNQDFTPESSREFGRRVRRMIPLVKDFVEGTLADFEPVLDAKQSEALREMAENAVAELDKIEARMNRWAEGDYKPDEHPFDNYSTDAEPAVRSDGKPLNPQMRQAEEKVNFILLTLEPTTWEPFVNSAAKFFKFDEQQKRQAGQILAEYQAKADEVMTPEWKQRVRENRLKQRFRDSLSREQPVAPWFWHLQYEFDLATKPLGDMGRSLRKEVLALATFEQRRAALSDVRKHATEHGLPIETADLSLLALD
jgi:hypothetical protein